MNSLIVALAIDNNNLNCTGLWRTASTAEPEVVIWEAVGSKRHERTANLPSPPESPFNVVCLVLHRCQLQLPWLQTKSDHADAKLLRLTRQGTMMDRLSVLVSIHMRACLVVCRNPQLLFRQISQIVGDHVTGFNCLQASARCTSNGVLFGDSRGRSWLLSTCFMT